MAPKMDDAAETEEIEITVRWETVHRIEVPKGWSPVNKTLDEFPPHVLDEIDSSTATIVDWY
jgi:hypothetical protein